MGQQLLAPPEAQISHLKRHLRLLARGLSFSAIILEVQLFGLAFVGIFQNWRQDLNDICGRFNDILLLKFLLFRTNRAVEDWRCDLVLAFLGLGRWTHPRVHLGVLLEVVSAAR